MNRRWQKSVMLLSMMAVIVGPYPGVQAELLSRLEFANRDRIVLTDSARLTEEMERALAATGCEIGSAFETIGARVIKFPRRHFLAIIPCGTPWKFDIALLIKYDFNVRPDILQFPIASDGPGLTSAAGIGQLSWSPELGQLTRTITSDICGDEEGAWRYVYHFSDVSMKFSLVKILRQVSSCEQKGPWTVVWNAPDLNLSRPPSTR